MLVILNELSSKDSTSKELEECESAMLDLSEVSRQVYNNIGSSVRESMRQRGLTLTTNVYIGFDTEYKPEEIAKNKFLSLQLAVNSKIYLQLPDVQDYSLCNLNTATGEEYPINSSYYSNR
jgi:hypothetical protein